MKRSILRTTAQLFLVAAAAMSAPACAFSAVITFTQIGSGTGSIGGVPFTSAHFTIVSVGNTLDRVGSGGDYNLPTSSSIVINGLGTYTFTTPTAFFISGTFNEVGLERASNMLDLMDGPSSTSLAGWAMQTSIGPISGQASLLQWSNPSPVVTSGGTLFIQPATVPTTFQAIVTVTSTTYSLAATASEALLHTGGTSTVGAQITNIGTDGADSLNYAGLNLNATAGSLSGGGLPLSGSSLGQGAQNSGSMVFTAGAAGIVVLTPVVSGATNTKLGTSASLGTTTTASIAVFSGSGNWNGTSSSWNANNNWIDNAAAGVRAAPGVWGYNDTASFNGAGTITAIDLSGVNPSLTALNFSNSGYTLSGGSLTLNSASGTANVTVNSGAQTLATPVALASNANFTINGGGLQFNTISGPGAFIKSGSGLLTLPGADTLNNSGGVSVTQGTLAAPFGISHSGGGVTLPGGAALAAAGHVNRAISGAGTVYATGDLYIGNSKQPGQFNQGGAPGTGGTLNIGGNAVVILSSDAAILGSQTTLSDSGSLTTLHGAQLGNPASLDSTKVLTAVGNATINSSFVNNGVVQGPAGANQKLTFTQFVKGAGSTTGNIEYAAGYSPGNSPAAVSVQNVFLDPTSTLVMELDGEMPGSGYDQLEITGLAALDGTLDVEELNGFVPVEHEMFLLFSGATSGQFSQLDLPALPSGLRWDASNLYSAGTLSVVPEPPTFMLLAVCAICTACFAWRRRLGSTSLAGG